MGKRPVVVLLVTSRTRPRALARSLRFLRWLLPAALLMVARSPAARVLEDDVITLNADALDSGPLTIADAVVKAHQKR